MTLALSNSLQTIPQKTHYKISNEYLSSLSIDRIFSSISRYSAISELRFYRCRFSEKALNCLFLFLLIHPQIKEIHLEGTSLDLVNEETLKTFMKQSSVEVLNLSGCNINPQKTKIIAEALKTNRYLNSLFLGKNPIGDEGVTYLAETLKHNQTLTMLNLRFCKITDRGVNRLAQSIPNSALTLLWLSHNKISNRGALRLCQALDKYKKLEILSLTHNQLTTEGTMKCEDILDFLSIVYRIGGDPKSAYQPMTCDPLQYNVLHPDREPFSMIQREHSPRENEQK